MALPARRLFQDVGAESFGPNGALLMERNSIEVIIITLALQLKLGVTL
jgi:hypothetical protein